MSARKACDMSKRVRVRLTLEQVKFLQELLPNQNWKLPDKKIADLMDDLFFQLLCASKDEPVDRVEAYDLLHNRGGEWLGAARSWLQRRKHNGSHVTWGSNEELHPPMTVKEVEEIAAEAAAEAINEERRKTGW